MDIVYIDFAKAFDTVSHKKLISKIASFGIQGTLLKWLSAFLTDRTFKVRVSNALSTSRSVISGVPQGSVLGPTLFLLYINDISANFINVSCKLFADDVKLYMKFVPENNINYVEQLRMSLKNLENWAKQWQLSISTQKCSVMHLGQNNPRAEYSLNDVYLPKVSHVKDLGVIISDDLKSSIHCTNVIKKRTG